jgi:LPS O-antigen subunit length determinant protein (WzzB/FepE family)
MGKKNSYIADDEIDFHKIIITLWREKILILFITIISILLVYFYLSSLPKEFRTEIKIKNPPSQLLLFYNQSLSDKSKINIITNFTSNFQTIFFSTDNIKAFLEESRDFDTFKKHLKSRNISANDYFQTKLGVVKKNNILIPNNFFLDFDENLDGKTFLNKYVEYVKKKNIIDTKKNFKISIETKIFYLTNALEAAKLINLESPSTHLLSEKDKSEKSNEHDFLFLSGTTILSKNISLEKSLLQRLENDDFHYDLILDKASSVTLKNSSPNRFYILGLLSGLLLSLMVIYLKNIIKK